MPKLNMTHWQILFTVDNNVITTTRTNFNLVDVLSSTGGIASIITVVFSILTNFIQKILF